MCSDCRLVLAGGGGGGADHVAEVIERATGHGSVQIDHADALGGHVVQQHVVELGVVVGHALRDVPGGDEIGDARAIRGAGAGEVDFRSDSGGAAGGVRGDGGFQCFQPFGSVVEIRDRFMQPFAAEGGGEFLEFPEGAGDLIGLLVAFEFIVTAGAFDERIDAPVVSIRIGGARVSRERRDAGECTAVGFRMSRGDERGQGVAGDALHVFHHLQWLFEDVVVDALDDEAHLPAGLIEHGAIRVVDVAGAIRDGTHEVRPHVEQRRDRADVVGCGHAGETGGFKLEVSNAC